MYRLFEKCKDYVKQKKSLKVREIIKKHNFSLVKAICSRLGFSISVANSLFNSNFIPDWMYFEIVKTANRSDPMTDLIFASKLMSRVRATLYEDPDCFPVVMNLFRKHSPLDVVVASMEKEYYRSNVLLSLSLVIVGIFIIGITLLLFCYMVWPSRVCEVITPNQFLIKLSTVSIDSGTNNTSHCLSQHEDGRKMLEYCMSLCNQTESDGTSDDNDYHQHWCDFITEIFVKMDWPLTLQSNTNITTSWCWSDMVPLFDCLKQHKTEL